MAFIQVKVTNPTKRNRAYPWFPGGLMLTPPERPNWWILIHCQESITLGGMPR